MAGEIMETAEWIAIVSTGVLAVGAIIAIYKVRPDNKKIQADAFESMSNTINNLLEAQGKLAEDFDKARDGLGNDFQIRLSSMEWKHKEEKKVSDERIGILETQVLKLITDNDALLAAVAELKYGVQILTEQIVALGHKPEWTPSAPRSRRREDKKPRIE